MPRKGDRDHVLDRLRHERAKFVRLVTENREKRQRKLRALLRGDADIALCRAERPDFKRRQARIIAEAKAAYQRQLELDDRRARGGRPSSKGAFSCGKKRKQA